MTEICTYQCDICGKVFDNVEDCRKHEMEHTIAPLKNAVVMFDAGGTILPLDNISTAVEWACAIYVGCEGAAKQLWELFEEEGYHPIIKDIDTPIQYPAFFVYDHCNNSCWMQMRDIEKEYNLLLELKATAEKTLLD